MRVVVLGGYGVFGTLLAELLVRDGHEVWIAGRNLEKAQACANRFGAHALRVDLLGDLQPVFDQKPDAVVDAAGPFQQYGEDPYRVARFCIRTRTNYLDLSDDAAFTAGIGVLDRQAREAGSWVLSGASSVPGLSSVVVKVLARDFDEILLIDTAILPGNRAPRGISVIESFVGQVGHSSPVWRGRAWRDIRCWTDKRTFEIEPGLTRTGYFINVPDIRLFPDVFGARSVMFRAGMELGVLNASLSALGALRQVIPLKVTPFRARFLQWFSNLLLPFGTDRGAMQVRVIGLVNGTARQRTWHLIAEAGDGPYTPGVVARVLLRRIHDIPPGARPCLSEITLPEIEDAMSDLAIKTKKTETARSSLFESALGERWSALPPEVRELHSVHDVESFSGVAQVTRGTSIMARLAAWFFGFPRAGDNVPLKVTKTRTDKGETWDRDFNGQILRSYLTPAPEPHRFRERFWFLKFELDLPVENGSMHLPMRRGWFLGIPIPRALLPGSDSREYAADGKFHFDVALSAPLRGGLIVHYRGTLVPDRKHGKGAADAV